MDKCAPCDVRTNEYKPLRSTHGYDLQVHLHVCGWVPESRKWPMSDRHPRGCHAPYEFHRNIMRCGRFPLPQSHHTMNAMGHERCRDARSQPNIPNITRQSPPRATGIYAHGHGRNGRIWRNVDCPPDNTRPMMAAGAAWTAGRMGGSFGREGAPGHRRDIKRSRLYENPPGTEAYVRTETARTLRRNTVLKNTQITPKTLTSNAEGLLELYENHNHLKLPGKTRTNKFLSRPSLTLLLRPCSGAAAAIRRHAKMPRRHA